MVGARTALAAVGLLASSARADPASDDVAGRVAQLQAAGADVQSIELRMKEARVTQNDQYSCHQYDAPGGDLKNYAVAFEGLEEAFGGKVHHMLLFGCDGPKNYDKNFACGMSAGPCRGLPRQTFLFGWAKDAAGIALPSHAGFELGPHSSIKTLVIQVHYAKPLPDPNSAGVRMFYTPSRELAGISNYAGVVPGIAASKLVIPPGVAKTSIPVTCAYTGDDPLHVFAYRVHAHDMSIGLPITWEMKRAGESQFSMVAQRDPGLPQIFNPLPEEVVINKGDTWRLTCNYNSVGRKATTRVGPTNQMEMCNLYLMCGAIPTHSPEHASERAATRTGAHAAQPRRYIIPVLSERTACHACVQVLLGGRHGVVVQGRQAVFVRQGRRQEAQDD